MSVTRITEFQSKDEQSSARLKEFVSKGVAIYEVSEGCQSCQLLQDHDDPKTILMLEVWDSIEARKSASKNIPEEVVEKPMELSSGPPHGRYFIT
jgi:quinol monooxygenase YgiN